MKNIVGIYCIYWNNNNYFYYGQTRNFYNRESEHRNDLQNGIHNNRFLQNVYNKYGAPTIEVVEECEISELNQKEEHQIKIWSFLPNCCNLDKSVFPGYGRKHTEDHKQHMRAIMKGRKPSIKCYEARDRHREMVRAGVIDDPLSPERRKEFSLKLGKHPLAKRVINNITGEVYDCAKKLSIEKSINYSTLRKYLQGNTKKSTLSIYSYIK